MIINIVRESEHHIDVEIYFPFHSAIDKMPQFLMFVVESCPSELLYNL